MTGLTHHGRCPACGQHVVTADLCTCTHPFTAHTIGTQRGEAVRTACTHFGCGCRTYTHEGTDIP